MLRLQEELTARDVSGSVRLSQVPYGEIWKRWRGVLALLLARFMSATFGILSVYGSTVYRSARPPLCCSGCREGSFQGIKARVAVSHLAELNNNVECWRVSVHQHFSLSNHHLMALRSLCSYPFQINDEIESVKLSSKVLELANPRSRRRESDS